jgi:hypothetical protein
LSFSAPSAMLSLAVSEMPRVFVSQLIILSCYDRTFPNNAYASVGCKERFS